MILGDFVVGLQKPFFLIAGPCVIESHQMALDTAGELKKITGELGIPFIYKSSFDKANRSSGTSFRGLGMEKGLELLADVRKQIGVPEDSIMACERGVSFGYNNLVSDMRSLAIMRETGCPVVFDATHSVQLPGGQG